MSFKDKVVWITGASSGIGEALTYALSKRGAKLIISSRRREALEEVKEQCEGNRSDIQIISLDLAESESLPGKTEEALAAFGHIDYLFNNGGISQRSLVMDTSMDVVRKVMEVNFFGTVALTKAILPSMIDRNSGHIIVTSSVMGKFGTRLRSSYAASKHALHGWFDCLRQEVYEHNIDVSLVCPGYIKTDVTLNALEGDGSRHGKMGKGQEKGMEPDTFTQKLLPKVLKGKEEIYIGGFELMGIYLKRFFPSLLNKVLKNSEVT
ncbi:SDR family oxidoreductase [Aliifodinibius sp. S!AR15-10]|uniref:SDR family oxidoreductase n=1 Tax=Aliifodinibius sp. S!AR15-10 TaxID=2950437 RepID=UPI00285D2651|nr:SDR family oxidoreductase [Aliifodinibius sp. S!AR15-10]MDR8392471.1 SDR family oxidoreductase [Aliifodinibius sp. S!AR15-10]